MRYSRCRQLFILMVMAYGLSASVCKTGGDDCMSDLKALLHKYSPGRLPEGEEAYYFHYEVKTIMKDKSLPSSATAVKMYVSKTYMQIESGPMVVYQDQKSTFTVIPIRKLIYHADSRLGQKDTSSANPAFTGFQSRILDQCTLKSCRGITGEKGYNKEAVLEPDEHLKKKYQMKSITFLIDSRDRSIHSTHIAYLPGSSVEAVDFTYYEVNFDYKKIRSGQSSGSKIYKADGTLLPEYAGYKVIDARASRNQ